ncbi:MAG: hypothetical protein M1528_03050 [Candidatus Marsarchaeota archaeon]|nr:hypothetical protein [Candidatus Marsarchaeota archaeon]
MGKEFFGALEKVFRSARFSGIGQPKSPITLKVGDTVFNVALTRPTPFERTIIDAAAHSGYQLGKVLNAAGMSDEVIVKQAEEEKSRIEDRRVSNSARFNRETRGEDLQYAAGLIQRLLVDIRGGFAQAPSTASPKELEDIAISMQERSYDFFRLPKGSPYA